MRKIAALALVLGAVVATVRPAAAQATGAGLDPALQAQAAAATAPAQAPVADPATTATTAPANGAENAVARFGPTVEGAKLLAPARSDAQDRQMVHAPAYRRSAPGVALLVVGGALFLAGALIDSRAGDAVMVAGVVVAAVGLYQYLQ